MVLSGESIDGDHLDHGYAVTVHRAQGATYDRAHVLAAGGGREVAYVALSRARTRTTLHAVAGDLEQARHDLIVDWSDDRQQRWVTDSATPAHRGLTTPSRQDSQVAATPGARRLADHRRLSELRADRHDLHAGSGRWEHTPEGEAARQLNDIRDRLDDARRRATAPGTRRRGRRSAVREVESLTPDLVAAEARWAEVGAPAAHQLSHTITSVEDALECADLEHRRQQVASFLDRRPPGMPNMEPDALRSASEARDALGL